MTRPTTEDDLAMRRSEHDAYEDLARHAEKQRLPSGLSQESDAHTRHHMQASSQWNGPKPMPCKWPECHGHYCQNIECDGDWDDEPSSRGWAWPILLGLTAAVLVLVAIGAAGYLLHPYLPPDWLAFVFGL